MCIYMNILMYMYAYYMYVYMYTYIYVWYLYIYIYIYTYIYICIYLHISRCVLLYKYTHLYTYEFYYTLSLSLSLSLSPSLSLYICKDINIYIYMTFSAPWATISANLSQLPSPKHTLEKDIWLERARRARSEGYEPSKVSWPLARARSSQMDFDTSRPPGSRTVLYVFASQGRHSRSPLKVASPGRHSMLKRSLARNIFALHAKKRSLKHSPGTP